MAKKEYFGETKAVEKSKRPTKRAMPKKAKRKYTRRKQVNSELVTIQVPASLAFQLGMHIGQTLSH